MDRALDCESGSPGFEPWWRRHCDIQAVSFWGLPNITVAVKCPLNPIQSGHFQTNNCNISSLCKHLQHLRSLQTISLAQVSVNTTISQVYVNSCNMSGLYEQLQLRRYLSKTAISQGSVNKFNISGICKQLQHLTFL